MPEVVTLPPDSPLIPTLVGSIALHPSCRADLRATPTKTWWVAIVAGCPVGVVAADRRPKHVLLLHAFVVPDQRGRGIYAALFDVRLLSLGTTDTLRTIATPEVAARFAAAGFIEVGTRGRFRVLERAGDE